MNTPYSHNQFNESSHNAGYWHELVETQRQNSVHAHLPNSFGGPGGIIVPTGLFQELAQAASGKSDSFTDSLIAEIAHGYTEIARRQGSDVACVPTHIVSGLANLAFAGQPLE